MSFRDAKREAMRLRIQASKIESEAIRQHEQERIIEMLEGRRPLETDTKFTQRWDDELAFIITLIRRK